MTKKPIGILACGASILGTLLLIIGFVAPGWFISNRNGKQRWFGLWFETVCTNGSCETKSLKQTYDEEHREVQYAYQVGSQILASLSLAAAIAGCVLTILRSRGSKSALIYEAKSVRCFVFSAAMILRVVGSFAAEINAQRKIQNEGNENNSFQREDANLELFFPYALLLSALGSLLLLFVAIWNFTTNQVQIRKLTARKFEEETPGRTTKMINKDTLQGSYPNIILIVLFLITCIGFLFQLGGFASPGWVIKEGNQDQLYAMTDYKISSTGLWYYVACKPSGYCKVESLHDFHKAEIERLIYDELSYAFVVGNQVCATLSQFVAGLAVFSGLISLGLKQRSIFLINITELCCLLSASLIWPVIGEIASNTVAKIEGETWSTSSYKFPYSLFLSAIGALMVFIAYVIYHLKFIMWLYQRRNDDENSTGKTTNSLEFTKL